MNRSRPLLVVLYHRALHAEGDVGGSILWRLPHFGHAGVDFFFVLSGFIITFVHHRDVGQPARLGHYLQRRFTRVFPFYWVVLAFPLLDAWLFHPEKDPTVGRIFADALLVPQGSSEIVGGAWTLEFEVLFYAIFALLVWNLRAGRIALVLWALLTAANFIDHSLFVTHVSRFFFSFPYYFEFFLGIGMATARIVLQHRIPASGIGILLGTAAFLVTGIAEARGLVDGFGLLARLLYGGSSAVVIASLVEHERSGRLAVPKPLAVLGRASYAVYLVHLIAIGIAFHFISRLIHLTPRGSTPLWLSLCVIRVGARVLASVWIEQPLIRATRRWIEAARSWSDDFESRLSSPLYNIHRSQ